MTLELFFGCVIVLALAAGIIAALSAQTRVKNSDNEPSWRKTGLRQQPDGNDNILR